MKMEYDIQVDLFGTKQYYEKGTDLLHREDGPAIEYNDGSKEWYIGGKIHRVGGPAIEWANGYKEWWINGRLHRLDGPAVEYLDGSKEWYFDDELHRIDGPAVECVDGRKEWWINGKRLSPEKKTILNKWWNNKNGI